MIQFHYKNCTLTFEYDKHSSQASYTNNSAVGSIFHDEEN